MMVRKLASIFLFMLLLGLVVTTGRSAALGSTQNPQSNAMGLEATVPGSVPTQAATIGIPSSGQIFTSTPITVAGLCKTGLLIKIFSNNIFVGSALCSGGSYTLKTDLFSGRNDLVARDFDTLDQQGPDSNVVSVTFNDAQFARFGTHISLTSTYARLGANPGDVLSWPLILSGGTGPYAISTDWGDSSGTSLRSVSFPGTFNLEHTYTQSGVYTVVVKATDANNTSSYLQMVGVATGKITGGLSSSGNGSQGNSNTKYVYIWQPLLVLVPLLLITFWLGKRHELYSIRRSLEEERSQY